MSTGRKSVLHNVCLRTFKVCTPLWRLCAEDLRVCRVSVPRVSNRVQLPPIRLETKWASFTPVWSFTMFKATPNPPETDTDSDDPLEAEKLKEAADRAFSYYFPPSSDKSPRRRNKSQLFTVCPDIDAEALLANASEDMLSISAIAADLADDVEGSRRSVALAISRMADGVQLLVERALDHYEALQMQLRTQAKV